MFERKLLALGVALSCAYAPLSVHAASDAELNRLRAEFDQKLAAIQAETGWKPHVVDFDAVAAGAVSVFGLDPLMRLSFQFNEASAVRSPTVDFRNIRLTKRFGRRIDRAPWDRLALTMSDVAGADTHGAMFWRPRHNTTTFDAVGLAAPTLVGTATAAAIAATNAHTYHNRLDILQPVAATNAIAGFYGAERVVSIGGAAQGAGGFRFVGRWGPATGVSNPTHRAFFGLSTALVAPTDVEPSTQINVAGMGWDAADANVQFMYNDGTGACVKIDLGAAFPVPTADRTDMYELRMVSPSGTVQELTYQVRNLTTNATAVGTIATGLPGTTTLLCPRGWLSAGGTSSVQGIAVGLVHLSPPAS
jgi:hypothetical protein